MSKTVKIAMVASLIAPMLLAPQLAKAEGKSKNAVSNMAIATNSESELDKVIDDIYKTYNNTMQHKEKLKIDTVKGYKQDIDSAVTKLIVKLQTELSVDTTSKKANQKLIKEVISMRDEVGQLIKQMQETNQEQEKQEQEKQEQEKAQLIEKNLNASVDRMNKIITKAAGSSTFAAVKTWDQLKEALANEEVEEIQIQGNIKADSNATVKARTGGKKLHLMGDDSALLDMQKYTIEIPNEAQLTAENLSFTGLQGGIAFSGEGKLTLTGDIIVKAGTKSQLASLPKGDITLTDAVMTLPSGLLYKGTAAFKGDVLVGHLDSFNLTIESSAITSDAENLFVQSIDYADVGDGKTASIRIDKGSKLTLRSHREDQPKTDDLRIETPVNDRLATRMEIFNMKAPTEMIVEGETTSIDIESDQYAKQEEYDYMPVDNGIFTFKYNGSSLIVQGASIHSKSKHISTLVMKGATNQLKLTEKAKLVINQEDDQSLTGISGKVPNAAPIRFSQQTFTETPLDRGASKITATGHSELSIELLHGVSPGVFLQGPGNEFRAEDGSDISILQKGDKYEDGYNDTDKIPPAGFYSSMFFALSAVTGMEDSKFIIHENTVVPEPEKHPENKYSQVNLDSNAGAAIVNLAGGIQIKGNDNTFFTARGSIVKKNGGVGGKNSAATIDSPDKLEFDMKNMSYYDFRNSMQTEDKKPHPDARVFNTEDKNSYFASAASDFAVWPATGEATENHGPFDVEGAPYNSWPRMTFKASSTGEGSANAFSKLEIEGLEPGKEENAPEHLKDFAGNYTKQYSLNMLSRINANNQAPIINQLRVPTNADKFIYGHALVPEGKFDPPRDAFPEEVYLKVELTDKAGEKHNLTGHTVEDKSDKEKPKADPQEKPVLNGKKVYDDDPAPGIFEIEAPKEGESKTPRFLEQGETIKVMGAWRSVPEEDENLVHIAQGNKLTAKEQIVQDVTPPDTPITDKDKIFHLEKELTGYAKEPGTIKLARGESEMLNTQTETDKELTEGKGYRFTLPLPKELNLQEGDKLTVLSRNTDQPKETTETPQTPEEAREMRNTNPVTFDEGKGNITPIDGPMSYHDRKGEDGFKPGAKVEVTGGILTLDGNPDFNFGKQKIAPETKTYYPTVKGGDLIVTDTLGEESTGWSLQLKDITEQTEQKNPLFGNLYYKKNKDDKPMKLSESATEVANKKDSEDEVVNITGSWVKGENGLFTILPVIDQVPGDFESTLNWSLVKGVPNNG